MQNANNVTPSGPGFGSFMVDVLLRSYINKKSGDTGKRAVVKGVAGSLAWGMIGPVGNFVGLAKMGTMLTAAGYNAGRKSWSKKKDYFYGAGSSFIGGPGGAFRDTGQALTIRQAAVHAIQESKINGRLVLGNEASYLHR